MNNAYIPAIAALAGSAIGALASFATTWLTQHSQERAQRYAQAMTLREQLYGGFIEEASKLFTDALTHELGDPSKFVALYMHWSQNCGSLPRLASSRAWSRLCDVLWKPTIFRIEIIASR
jgi:hypothetical protein